MPTKTFFNLPIEKQKNLLEASEREFSRVSFDEASINQIIQDAKISRGSFYMYFEDKEDLYFYLLQKYQLKMYQKLIHHIDSSHKDFITAWSNFYDCLIDSCFDKNKGELLKKMFLNMRFSTSLKFKLKPPKDMIRDFSKELLSHIDRSLYRYQDDEALLDIFSFVMLTSMSSIVYTLMNPMERNREKENYDRRLEIIRSGVIRRDKDV